MEEYITSLLEEMEPPPCLKNMGETATVPAQIFLYNFNYNQNMNRIISIRRNK